MNILLRWWRFAQAVVLGITTPAADVALSDRAFESQLRDSGGFHALSAAGGSLERAATTSRVVDAIAAVGREWRSASREARVAAVGMALNAAGATALVLELVTPRSDSFVLVVPSCALIVGLLVVAARAPVAAFLNRLDS